MRQLIVRTQSGNFHERHTHHSMSYLQDLADVYKRHGYITTIEEF